jgi:serine acetyltransferase
VGAFSVVTKDVPPWTVCAGNPCRVIKARRLDEPTDTRLDGHAPSEDLDPAMGQKVAARLRTR